MGGGENDFETEGKEFIAQINFLFKYSKATRGIHKRRSPLKRKRKVTFP